MPTSNIRALYEATDRPRPLPEAVLTARWIADDTWNDLAANAALEGIDLPGDSRAEEIVTSIFAYVVRAAGLDPAELGEMVQEAG